MRRGSLPRGSAHRLYRSRLPNDFATLGTTVLEAAAWAMAASAARQSRKTFVAAAFARICVAFGHLLGALIARSMLVLSNADASAIQAGSLVVSVYFMVALFLGRASTEAATSEHAIAAGNARDIPGGNVRGGQQQATKEHTRHVGHARGVPA